jgi:hypothetical protein
MTYDLLRRLGSETKADVHGRIARGEQVDEGARHVLVFQAALAALRDGLSAEQALEKALAANETQCVPPYSEKLVRKQVRGAVKFAAAHPTETERARAEARRILRGERRNGAGPQPSKKSPRKPRRELRVRVLSSVAARRAEFLAPGIPAAAPMLCAGCGGLGKTAYAIARLAPITRAGQNIVVISYEDAVAEVLRPRAEAAGADLDHVHVVSVDELDGSVSFPADLPELDRIVRETGAVAVLIDPVSASLDVRLDSHKDQHVRIVLGQLARLAERERTALILNGHLNKREDSRDAYVRILGSSGFYNAARSVVLMTPDPRDPDWQRLVCQVKSNYGPLGDIERWRVMPTLVQGEDGPVETMRIEFVEIADDVSRADVLDKPSAAGRLDDAVDWLQAALADGDWHDAAGLKILAAAAGIAERTLKRAAQELEVEHERRGFPSSTWWQLPRWGQPQGEESGPTEEPS